MGFNFDSRNYYTGLNLITLLLYKNTEDTLIDFKKILPVVRYNIELEDFSISNDYWLLASALELYILMEDFDKLDVVLGYISTLTPEATIWMKESTMRNLNLIKEIFIKKDINIDWYEKTTKSLDIKEV